MEVNEVNLAYSNGIDLCSNWFFSNKETMVYERLTNRCKLCFGSHIDSLWNF